MKQLIFMIVLLSGAVSACKKQPMSPVEKYKRARALYEKDVNDPNVRTLLADSCEGKFGPACFNLGMMALKGQGGEKNRALALKMFRGACVLLEPKGCYNLGLALAEGDPPAIDESLPHFETGCRLKHGGSCNYMGYLHQMGKLGPHSFELALPWYKKACLYNYVKGCYNLGMVLKSGQLDEGRDLQGARDALSTACEQKYMPACTAHAFLLIDEKGDISTQRAGVAILRRACEMKEAQACVVLAKMYEKGFFVAKDDTQSRRYAKLACGLGMKTACYMYSK